LLGNSPVPSAAHARFVIAAAVAQIRNPKLVIRLNGVNSSFSPSNDAGKGRSLETR
jgi:hypothetical protein